MGGNQNIFDSHLGVEQFFNLAEVPFPELFETTEYVWEALAKRNEYIRDNIRPNIEWIERDGITIEGEVSIGPGVVIEPGA